MTGRDRILVRAGPGRAGQARMGVLLGLLLAVVAVGCSGEREGVTVPPYGRGNPVQVAGRAPRPVDPIASVAVIGDSITVGAEADLDASLRALGLQQVSIAAADGRRMTVPGDVGSGLELIDLLVAAGAPDVWVVALGTNDIGQYADAVEYAMAINDVLVRLPTDAPLVWVNTWVEFEPDQSQELNQTLAASLRVRGQATVADWAAAASPGGLLRDGVHPTPGGQARFVEVVTDAVSAWMG